MVFFFLNLNFYLLLFNKLWVRDSWQPTAPNLLAQWSYNRNTAQAFNQQAFNVTEGLSVVGLQTQQFHSLSAYLYTSSAEQTKNAICPWFLASICGRKAFVICQSRKTVGLCVDDDMFSHCCCSNPSSEWTASLSNRSWFMLCFDRIWADCDFWCLLLEVKCAACCLVLKH